MRQTAEQIWEAMKDGRLVFHEHPPEVKMNYEGGPFSVDSFDITMGPTILIPRPPTGLAGLVYRSLRQIGLCIRFSLPAWDETKETWQEYIAKHYVVIQLTPERPTWLMPAHSEALVISREDFSCSTGEDRTPAWEGRRCLVADVSGKTGRARTFLCQHLAHLLHAHVGKVTMELMTGSVPVLLFVGYQIGQVYLTACERDTSRHHSAVRGQQFPNGLKMVV
jgi:hypothetical protein